MFLTNNQISNVEVFKISKNEYMNIERENKNRICTAPLKIEVSRFDEFKNPVDCYKKTNVIKNYIYLNKKRLIGASINTYYEKVRDIS